MMSWLLVVTTQSQVQGPRTIPLAREVLDQQHLAPLLDHCHHDHYHHDPSQPHPTRSDLSPDPQSENISTLRISLLGTNLNSRCERSIVLYATFIQYSQFY